MIKLRKTHNGEIMEKYIAKRLNDGYEEPFSSMSEFSRKYDVGVSSISRIINNKNETTYARGWTFKRIEEEYKIPEVKIDRYIAKRLSDNYKETIDHWEREDFAEKHNLDLKKLKDILKGKKRVYDNDSEVWVFKKDNSEETFPKPRIYMATRVEDGYEEKFYKIIDFARKYDLFPMYISRILRKKKAFKTTKGWTFRKMEFINKEE